MISLIELSNSIVNTTVNIICQPAPPPIFAITYCSMLTCRGSWVWSHVVPVDTVQWETFEGENLQILRFCESFLPKNYFPPTCKSVLLYGKWYPGALKKQYFAIAPSSESLDWSYNETNQLEYMTPEITLSSLTLIQPLLATCTCNSTFRCCVHVCIWSGPINFDAVHLASLLMWMSGRRPWRERDFHYYL